MSNLAAIRFNRPRRSFLETAAVGVAASHLGVNTSAFGQADARALPLKLLEPLKSIDAGALNIGYFETRPAEGAAVILLHGWPYDIHTYVDVAPILAAAGFRVIVPHLRGYGTTRFISDKAVRNGQQAVVAVDVVALTDALRIDRATIAGCDWGARTACIVAALWPERVKALVSVSGYLIGSQEAGKSPLPPQAELQWWYQYYLPPNEAAWVMPRTGTTSRSLSGSSLRRNGISTPPLSTAAPAHWTTPITSAS